MLILNKMICQHIKALVLIIIWNKASLALVTDFFFLATFSLDDTTFHAVVNFALSAEMFPVKIAISIFAKRSSGYFSSRYLCIN